MAIKDQRSIIYVQQSEIDQKIGSLHLQSYPEQQPQPRLQRSESVLLQVRRGIHRALKSYRSAPGSLSSRTVRGPPTRRARRCRRPISGRLSRKGWRWGRPVWWRARSWGKCEGWPFAFVGIDRFDIPLLDGVVLHDRFWALAQESVSELFKVC